jgi:GT2 family glycosyltransferase
MAKDAGPIQVSVVVLFFNGETWVQSCMESLLDQTLERDRYELILADNGGNTPSLDRFTGKKNVRIIRWKQNLGFAAGNNRAVAMAAGRVILLLNQDVVVHRRCLESIWRGFAQHPQWDVLSTNMQMVDRLETGDRKGPAPATVGWYRLSPLGHADYRMQPFAPDPIPVDFVSGNGLAFRAGLLPKIGGYLFDERLFNYAEDLDLSLRLTQQGFRMAVLPDAAIYHFRDDPTTGSLRQGIRKFVHISGNRLLVYRRRLDPVDFCRMFPLLMAGIPLKVSRMDGEKRFHSARVLAGAALLPMVFFDFVTKSFRQQRLPPFTAVRTDVSAAGANLEKSE